MLQIQNTIKIGLPLSHKTLKTLVDEDATVSWKFLRLYPVVVLYVETTTASSGNKGTLDKVYQSLSITT